MTTLHWSSGSRNQPSIVSALCVAYAYCQTVRNEILSVTSRHSGKLQDTSSTRWHMLCCISDWLLSAFRLSPTNWQSRPGCRRGLWRTHKRQLRCHEVYSPRAVSVAVARCAFSALESHLIVDSASSSYDATLQPPVRLGCLTRAAGFHRFPGLCPRRYPQWPH